MYSPLYPTRRSLKFFRWTCGFPLQTKDGSYTVFRFVNWLEMTRFILVFSLSTIDYLYPFAFNLIYYGGLSNFLAFYKEGYSHFSISKNDQIVMIVWHIFVAVSLLVYIITFKYNTESLSDYCKEISEVKSDMGYYLARKPIKEKPKTCCAVKEQTKTLILQVIINLILSIISGLWIYYFFLAKMNQHFLSVYIDSLPVVYGILLAIRTFFIIFGPINWAVEHTICQLINSLCDAFDSWIELLRSNSDAARIDDIPNSQKNDCEETAFTKPFSET